jgi:hypothetical protein
LTILLPALLLVITCVLDVWMSNASPFQTSTFQELSNYIKNNTSHWVLALEIAIWSFENPLGLHLPKWELLWECECSPLTLPHTFLHSWEYVMWLLGFLLAHALVASLPWLSSFLLACNLATPWSRTQNYGCDIVLGSFYCECTHVELGIIVIALIDVWIHGWIGKANFSNGGIMMDLVVEHWQWWSSKQVVFGTFLLRTSPYIGFHFE